MSRAQVSKSGPHLGRAVDALADFARVPVDEVSTLPNSDMLFCEVVMHRTGVVRSYTVGLYRQLSIPEGEGEELYRVGFDIELDESAELLSATPTPQKAFVPIIELWGDASDLDEWLTELRRAPAYRTLAAAQMTSLTTVNDRL